MMNNDYVWPGLAAIALAMLTPVFWLYVALSDYTDGIGQGLVAADWVFLLMGFVTVYVYYALRRILHDHHNFRDLDIFLAMIIAVNVVFYLGGFALELFAPLFGDNLAARHESALGLNMLLTAGCTVAFGIIDILIAFVLMRNSAQLPYPVKVFAIVTLIQGIFELTILFSFFTAVIYPVALIVLAVYFLRKPETIEVI